VEEILREPYARILIPAEEGGYTAEILEFPGCIAEGETPEDAIANLEASARSWVQAALDQGQDIPEPSAVHEFSGRIVLRMPRGLHKTAARLAMRNDTSLNQYFLTAIAASVGAGEFYERLVDRIEARLTPIARNVIIVSEGAIQAWSELRSEPMLTLPDIPRQTASSIAARRVVEVTSNA
jgi:predicted RNase H-like HicB family nuclease